MRDKHDNQAVAFIVNSYKLAQKRIKLSAVMASNNKFSRDLETTNCI
jgi:hypothetical protein